MAGKWAEGDIIDVDCVNDELVFVHGTGEIPKLRQRESLALEAPQNNYSLPSAGGVGAGSTGELGAAE